LKASELKPENLVMSPQETAEMEK